MSLYRIKPMTRFSAIIFDLDGTLVDTVGHIESVYAFAMQSFGITNMSTAAFRSLYEKNATTGEYLEHFGIDLSHKEEFCSIRDEMYMQTLKEKAEWMRGAEAMLQILQPQIPLAIATGAQKQYIDAIHGRLGLLNYFSAVSCADDEGYKRKPDSFTLLRAAESLGINPASALYVGDQLTDVRAARASHMQCCFIGSASPDKSTTRPDFIIASLNELPFIFSSTKSPYTQDK